MYRSHGQSGACHIVIDDLVMSSILNVDMSHNYIISFTLPGNSDNTDKVVYYSKMRLGCDGGEVNGDCPRCIFCMASTSRLAWVRMPY